MSFIMALSLLRSVCVCNFNSRPDETYALVGTAKDLTLTPRSCAGGFIHTYKIAELIDGGYKLEFVHKVCIPVFCFLSLQCRCEEWLFYKVKSLGKDYWSAAIVFTHALLLGAIETASGVNGWF